MRRAGSAIAAVLVLTGLASAQSIPIHNSPQKSAYASAAEWPTVSAQCHWKDVGVNAMNMVAHTHLDLTFPFYAEWSTGPITAKWTITMFHTDGYVSDPGLGGYAFQSPYVKSYTLDAPFQWPLQGNPDGVAVYTGTVTVDASLATQRHEERDFPIPHGWYDFTLHLRTSYPHDGPQGKGIDTALYVPVYSLLDPSAPEPDAGAFSTGHPRLSTYCWAWDDWNAVVTETYEMLPILAPVASDTPWTFTPIGYSYGSNNANLAVGTFEYRIDPDLHNNIPGTIVETVTATDAHPDATLQIVTTLPGFNPTGTHKQMFRYIRPDASGTRELDALLVWNQVVSTNTPPPPPTGCTAGNATTPASTTALDGSVKHYLVTVDAACNPVTVVGPF